MSKFSGFYAPWEHPVCPECLAEKEYCLHLALVQCLKPASHSRYDRIPVVVDQDNLLLRKVQPLPGRAFQFRGGFVACHHYPNCRNGDTCWFPHSEFDRIAWSTKKLVLLKGKSTWSGYESTLHTYTHTLPMCSRCHWFVHYSGERQQSTIVL